MDTDGKTINVMKQPVDLAFVGHAHQVVNEQT